MIVNTIKNMLKDLQSYRRSREDIWIDAVSSRLNSSLSAYASSLDSSVDYLERRENKNLMKKVLK